MGKRNSILTTQDRSFLFSNDSFLNRWGILRIRVSSLYRLEGLQCIGLEVGIGFHELRNKIIEQS